MAIKYPRVEVSVQLHERLSKLAKRKKTSVKGLSDKVIRAGLKALHI